MAITCCYAGTNSSFVDVYKLQSNGSYTYLTRIATGNFYGAKFTSDGNWLMISNADSVLCYQRSGDTFTLKQTLTVTYAGRITIPQGTGNTNFVVRDYQCQAATVIWYNGGVWNTAYCSANVNLYVGVIGMIGMCANYAFILTASEYACVDANSGTLVKGNTALRSGKTYSVNCYGTSDGLYLFAQNITDGTLDVFSNSAGTLTYIGSTYNGLTSGNPYLDGIG